MDEESKAVQEVAKTTGKAIDAAREAGGFIAKFISGPLEQGVGIFEDKLKYLRWERQIRYMERAQEFLNIAGLDSPTRAVPIKLAIPLMQGASLEEDNQLQDLWAALLANSANASYPIEIRRSYVAILEQLTSLDAQVLDAIYALPFEAGQHAGISTAELPVRAQIIAKDDSNLPLPPEEIILSLSNLARLGCIRPIMTWGGGESYSRINPTVAGKAFMQACRIPGT